MPLFGKDEPRRNNELLDKLAEFAQGDDDAAARARSLIEKAASRKGPAQNQAQEILEDLDE